MSVFKHNNDMYATNDLTEMFYILSGNISNSEKEIDQKYGIKGIKYFNRVIVV
jgi:hypothetical protein